MDYIAHIRGSDFAVQLVEEHLLEVRALAERYGASLGISHIAGLAGLLHDAGKYADEFQVYIRAVVYHPETAPAKGSVDHATAGGRLLYKLLHMQLPSQADAPGKLGMRLAEIVGNAIISHHSYLHDFVTPEAESEYLRRVRDKELLHYDQATERFYERVMSEDELLAYISIAQQELLAFLRIELSTSLEQKYMFLTKLVFSILIDADRTNTRCFEDNLVDEAVPYADVLERYHARLDAHLRELQNGKQSSRLINRLRQAMSEQCEQFACNLPGIYTLSIPTGGGKTLASLRYALAHARKYGKQRIIYVVPYTTIIEQNVNTVRDILKEEQYILEHHSNIAMDDDDDEVEEGSPTDSQRLKLARDNWDSPVIFTTMVQYLNAFFAGGTRNIRRLHRLTEAVVIFDEVQKVPTRSISLFNQAANFLKHYGHSTLLMCTATQPELDYVRHRLAIEPEGEMIANLDEVSQAFKRVELVDAATNNPMGTEELADLVLERSADIDSVLVILNTKAVVRRLYQRLEELGPGIPVYHLSTSMCPAHRTVILDKVRKHLEQEEPVVCISTQLIEAGVDVSFRCVIRSLAGLDSIAQAAGRCNRHGRELLQYVYLIDHREEKLERLPEIAAGKAIAQAMLVDLRRDPASYGGSLLSVAAMERYFQEFYTRYETQLNYPVTKLGSEANIVDLLSVAWENNPFLKQRKAQSQPDLPLMIANSYRTAANHFEVIESMTTSVLVPYEGGKKMIADLNGARSISDLSRLLHKAQKYTINLYRYELDAISKNHGLVNYLDGKVLALTEGAYDPNYGFELGNDGRMSEYVF